MSERSEAEQTYDLSLLKKSEKKWRESNGLRTVYGSMYRDIGKRMTTGASLELGSGIAGIKAFLPGITTSDILKTPYVDMACSAYDIPLRNSQTGEKWCNIVALDMLHHLCRPMDFLGSAAAALGEGGKVILVEPAGTLYGRLFYGLFHPEPVSPGEIIPPFVFDPDKSSGEFANMAMGICLFVKYRHKVDALLEGMGLRLTEIVFRDVLAYPLTGGYSGQQLLPASWLKCLLALESHIPQWMLKWFALRMVVVIEKR